MKKKITDLLSKRLQRYNVRSDRQTINAAKEIIQELALLGLSRIGFFKKAAFHGGSALRIFYGLDRFSEDLDFCLQQPDKNYSLKPIIAPLFDELSSWGLKVEIVDRARSELAVKKAFLKESSLGAQLTLEHPLHRAQKFVVKLEIDTTPPGGAGYTNALCEFPTDFYVTTHDLPSMFAGKIHSILCRPYLKGRDWYDLMEYFSRKVSLNYPFLHNALAQQGPLKESLPDSIISLSWITARLRERIATVNAAELRADVLPFVEDESRVSLWSREFFLDKLELWAAKQPQ